MKSRLITSQPDGPWLDPVEQRAVIERLVAYGLLGLDPSRKQPLKSGGETDIYANLRLARNKPAAMKLLAEIFKNPLRRLGADRVVDVPEAVSCFTGQLACSLGIPMVTVREDEKQGRVVKGKLIGGFNRGERAVIVDDVVTDGASKITPYRECIAGGANPWLVVLVDRQQGWRKKFAELGIDMPVWAGMTLHDIRRWVIENGLMRRCDPKVEEVNKIILALDGKDWEEILPTIDVCRPTGVILKVNDLLIAEGSDTLLRDLQVYGRVMADPKIYDIETTAGNVAKRLKKFPPWAVTVHGSGGEKMIKAVVDMFKGTPTKVLVVTVLTSIDPATCEEIYTRQPIDQVRKLAAIAVRAGAHGVVCSAKEVEMMRKEFPQLAERVVPGVRSPGAETHDQQRVDTPANTVTNGATHVVMGRQVMEKTNPVAELNRVNKEELSTVAA